MKTVFKFAILSTVGVFGYAGAASATATSNAPANQVVAGAVTQAASSAVASVVSAGVSTAAASVGVGGGGGGATGATPAVGGQTSDATRALWTIDQTGLASAAAARGIGLWVQGAYTNAESTFNKGTNNDMRFKGDIWAGSVGADYRVTQRIVLGAAVGYQYVDVNTTFNSGKLKQTGWGVTPYAVFALTQNYFIDVSGGYYWLDNEMQRNSNTARANYDGERWSVGGNLNGAWKINNWQAAAAVGYLYVKATDDAFRETGSAAQAAIQASQVTKLGQGRLGGSLGYSLGNITPYGMARVEHNFEQPKVSLNSGVGGQPPEARTGYRIGAGLKFNVSSAVSGDVSANTLLGKDDYKEYGVGGTLRIAF
jgi:outer membrane autotransporter protein